MVATLNILGFAMIPYNLSEIKGLCKIENSGASIGAQVDDYQHPYHHAVWSVPPLPPSCYAYGHKIFLITFF